MGEAAAMLLAHPRRDDQLGELGADRFLTSKTKNTLGGGIEFEDAPFGIHGDDAVERGFQDRLIKRR